MPESKREEDRVDELAEEFARRWRSGDEPSVEEYALRYPQWAEQIREVLPAVVLMEQLKPRRDVARPAAALGERPLERLGDYRILGEIGRGGMGVVYEAEQEALGRRVALKVLPAHLLADERLRARFQREARAAARLHHTNIVPVFDVGEHEGLCFYAMQLIPGRSLDLLLTQAADSRKEQAAKAPPPHTEVLPTPAPTSSPASADTDEPSLHPHPSRAALAPWAPGDLCRAAARIGVQVAEALDYAHTQGVLHRDIKPSNLLVDDRGAVWVTDFGVAKLVEEANLTQSGDLVGTLKYMPPERFSGHSDARGDVYSLGVTLYELLTLQPAFPDTTPHHLIQLITHEAPVRPRRHNPAIPADLETIVLKALARDPAHRYPSAAELAEDLRRFLDDRPIQARRITLAERGWRWCRRNPALALAITASLLLMVAITVISVVAKRETAKTLTAEKAQREQAENTATLALEALNRTYDRFAPSRFVVAPQTTSEEGIELPAQPAALSPEVVPLLEDLLHTYGQIARSGGEFPRLRAQAAEANHRIGDIAQRLGRFEEAAAAYRAAIDLYTQLADDSPEDAVRIKLARACNDLARLLRALQQPEEARQMHDRAIRILTDAPLVLARRPECRYELARSYCIVGSRDMFLSPGPKRPPPPGGPGRRPPGPEPHPHLGKDHPSQRAAALLEDLVHDHPSVPEYRHLLACCYRDMPPGGFGPGQLPKRANMDRAVELLRELVQQFPQVPDYRFDLCEALGRPGPPTWMAEKGLDKQTKERLEEAITRSGKLMAQYPNMPAYAAAHARYLDALGMALFHARRFVEAEEPHHKAVNLQWKLVQQHPEVIAYRCWLSLMERSLGCVRRERGDLKEARALIEGAINRVEELCKNDPRLVGLHPFLGLAYRDLAETLSRCGDAQGAARALTRAEEHGKDHPHGPPPHHDKDWGPPRDR
jgi:serine/threonine protein kinase